MDKRIIDVLRGLFPFLVTLMLWRGALPLVNPGGMLALIPVFFCTFIRPVPWFALFGAVMCFLVDYRADTLLFWTTVFCICYAANGFQSVIDLTRADRDGMWAFAAYFGVATLIISIPHLINFTNFFRMIWTVLWAVAMYVPITSLIKKVAHD